MSRLGTTELVLIVVLALLLLGGSRLSRINRAFGKHAKEEKTPESNDVQTAAEDNGQNEEE